MYAKVRHKVRDRFVCNSDRTPWVKTTAGASMASRFAILIGVAAVGVMALGAQPAAAVVEYDTHLTITQDTCCFIHGSVLSDGASQSPRVRKCEVKRRVVLFRQRPGTDAKLGMTLSGLSGGPVGSWGVRVGRAQEGWRVYAKAKHKVRDQFVCLADRSRTYTVE